MVVMAAETRRLPRLPACRHCSTKKVKCDSSRPKCSICTKNGLDCVMYDSVSQNWISREHIDSLERRASQSTCVNTPLLHRDAASATRPSPALASPEKINTGRSMGSSTTLTRGAGISFISLLFSDAEWRRSNADLLKSLNQASQPPEKPVDPCALPSATVVQDLFETYLTGSHILNPVLIRQEVWDLYHRLFSNPDGVEHAASHDLFRAFIICAIACVIPYRTGLHTQHPGGYYHAALNHIGSQLLTRGLDSIQDLLLIGRFGVFHHIGISIWELAQLCGRLCIEQGLHCGDAETGNLLQDQKKRRIFWQVYLIDRYSSITLDRPFALDDASIEIGLPVDADDNDLACSSPSVHSLDAFAQYSRPSSQTDVTVFLCALRLRRLSSRIHATMATLRQDPSIHSQPYLAVGRICAALNSLLRELEAWYESVPTIPNPRCLYESSEWFSLLFCRERIDLVRRAVDLIPKANGAPPRHVVSLFLRAALTHIKTYATLSERKSFISYTRNYFHIMFTAGLSAMYCTSVSHYLGPAELSEVLHGLRTCEETLVKMSEQLSDARSYTAVFAALHRHISKKILRTTSGSLIEGSTTQAVTAPGDSAINEAAYARDHVGTFQEPLVAQNYISQDHTGTNVPGLVTDPPMQNITATGWENIPMGGFEPSASMFMNHGLPTDSANGHDFRGPIAEPTSADDDLLQWAFLHDESVWNMDLMLGEYAYGDPAHSGPLNGVSM